MVGVELGNSYISVSDGFAFFMFPRVYFTPTHVFGFIVGERVKMVSETSEGDEVSRNQIKVQASLQILPFQNGVTDA